jgi:hypothetical protein
MNQLDLILENIRLGHIEQLLQEAQSDLEVIRGQRLINESIMQIRGALIQEFEAAPVLEEVPSETIDPTAGAMVAGGLGLAGAGAYRYGQGAGNALRAAKTMSQYGAVPAMKAAATQMKNGAEPQIQADTAAIKQATQNGYNQVKTGVQNGYTNVRNHFVK